MSAQTPISTVGAEPISVAKVTLGGVTLATRSWQWPFTTGATSPEVRLIVDNVVDAQLQGLEGRQTLECEGTLLNDEQKVTFKHEGIYLRERQRISPWEVRWILADQRRQVSEVMVGGRFNVTRRANTLDSAQQPDAFGILEQLNTIRRYRYVPSTMRHEPSVPPLFAPLQFDVREDGQATPWSAYWIVLWLLQRGYRAGGVQEDIELVLDDDVEDNGHVEEDVVFGVAGERFASVLDRFLNLARLGLYVNERSQWVLYDLAAPPITAKVGDYPGAGTLAKEDLSRVRPAEFVWRCGAIHEVMCTFVEAEGEQSGLTGFGDVILDNVGVLPSAVELDGVRRERGEYLTIDDLIAAYNKLGWPTGKTLTKELLRKGKLARSMLHREFCVTPGTGRLDAQASNRMEALRNAYRRVYRLPQWLLDSILGWEAARTARLDAITGQRMPSPVWTDYAALPTGKMKIGRGAAASAFHAVNVPYPDTLSEDSDPSPFAVSVIDQDLGIFAVDYNAQDPSGRVSLLTQGTLTNPMGATFFSITSDGMYETIELDPPPFTMSTIITVRLASPNGLPSNYALKGEANQFGVTDAKGPRYEARELREVARWRWEIGKTRIKFRFSEAVAETGQPAWTIEQAELLNKAALTALARASGQRVYWSFADRWIGRYERPRYEAGVDRPRGNAQTVTVRFEAGRLTTTYVLPEGAPPPDLYELLPSAVRQEYYRQIGRGA